MLALALTLAACGDDDDAAAADAGATDASADASADAATDAGLPDRCNGGTQWAPGAVAFEEATSDWGTDAIGAEGTRISVADVDGDGYPDLAVRRAGSQPDDFAGARNNWLLRNVDGTRFEDVTEESGLWTRREPEPSGAQLGRPGEIVVFADVDDDGDLDAFTGLPETDPPSDQSSEILLNDGTGHFVLGPEDSDIRLPGARAAAAFTDFDRDGLIDLWIGNAVPPGGSQPQPEMLARGDGSGAFADVSGEAGIYTYDWASIDRLNDGVSHAWAWSVAACDLDGDGTAELLVASYGRGPSILWEGSRDPDGEVTYENRGVASGYAYDDRVDWTDNESARCYCELNPAAEDCDGVPPPARLPCPPGADLEPGFRWRHETDRELFRLGGNMGATVCADVDRDGDLDLLTTSIVHWDVGSSSDPSELLVNTGDESVRFERPGNEATGLSREHDDPYWNDGDISAGVFDFDNDGRLDVLIASTDYPGARALLWRQGADGRFVEVPIDEGIDHHRAHGVGVADLDRDGDLDVVLGHSNARCEDDCYESFHARVYENVLGQDGNWVQLTLRGAAGTNAFAIGARVQVAADGATQTQEVGGGFGHYGAQADTTLHFGLGAACAADVRVRWPDASLDEQSFRVQAGYRYVVEQGLSPRAVE